MVMLNEVKIGDLVAVRGYTGEKQMFGLIVRVAHLRDDTQYWVRLAPHHSWAIKTKKPVTYPFVRKQLEMLSCAQS